MTTEERSERSQLYKSVTFSLKQRDILQVDLVRVNKLALV